MIAGRSPQASQGGQLQSAEPDFLVGADGDGERQVREGLRRSHAQTGGRDQDDRNHRQRQQPQRSVQLPGGGGTRTGPGSAWCAT